MSRIDGVIFHIDVVNFHIDLDSFDFDIVNLRSAPISILSSCHPVDRMARSYFVTLFECMFSMPLLHGGGRAGLGHHAGADQGGVLHMDPGCRVEGLGFQV